MGGEVGVVDRTNTYARTPLRPSLPTGGCPETIPGVFDRYGGHIRPRTREVGV